MKVTVTGPNFGAPYSKSIVKTITGAITVMSHKLGIAHEDIDFEIMVGRTVDRHDEGCRGWAHAHRDRQKWIATIFVMREKSVSAMLSTLAHELIHIKQFIKDGLDLNTSNFKGKKWAARKDQSIYYDSPWEKEAYSKELSLLGYYEKYMQKNG